MISSLLVANRGEIAVRIIQTCREMGIRTIAVYSEVDRTALHVRMADEACLIGPSPALESYLSIPALLHAARESGAEAVHPGYGFLAENVEFAAAVLGAGMTWVGPAPEVIAALGDKLAAKALATRAGVPVVPGYSGSGESLDEVADEAQRIGFPLMVKAAAGGGGKGMRVVRDADQLAPAWEAARREAKSAFDDDRVFLEKLLERPRHIEMQILVDDRGNAIYLGERDCSLQRRHQKVLEESPSPVMTNELRTAMGEAAIRVARAAGYRNAGTVEFLYAGDEFYFLEVNTRLQVEHPVTELVTGLDLVRLQIEVACGLPLPISQPEIQPRGHAIEVRLYAEDPERGFLPVTGTVTRFQPPSGPGFRSDVGVYEGIEVSPYYDPMLAKFLVYAPSRSAAVARLQYGLARYEVGGLTTNLSFLRWIATDPGFVTGRVDTGYIDREWSPISLSNPDPPVVLAAAIFDLTADQPTGEIDPWRGKSGWRPSGLRRVVRYRYGENEYSLSASVDRDEWSVWCNGQTYTARVQFLGKSELVLRVAERDHRFSIGRTAVGLVVTNEEGVSYQFRVPILQAEGATRTHEGNDTGLTSPMPGTVVKVAVIEGQQVQEHDPLVVLEAMKMEHVIEAPYAGVIRAILVEHGDLVSSGSPVVRMDAL